MTQGKMWNDYSTLEETRFLGETGFVHIQINLSWPITASPAAINTRLPT